MAKRPAQLRRHYIKEWREFRSLTQEQLAGRIEKSRGLVAQLELYRTAYTQPTLEAIADALDTDTWQLLNVNPLKEGDVVDLTALLKSATPEQRAEIIGFARGRLHQGTKH